MKMSADELVLKLAQGVDVAPYRPMETFEEKFDRRPTVAELADLIVDIRMIEGQKLLARIEEAKAAAGEAYR